MRARISKRRGTTSRTRTHPFEQLDGALLVEDVSTVGQDRGSLAFLKLNQADGAFVHPDSDTAQLLLDLALPRHPSRITLDESDAERRELFRGRSRRLGGSQEFADGRKLFKVRAIAFELGDQQVKVGDAQRRLSAWLMTIDVGISIRGGGSIGIGVGAGVGT